LAGGPGPFDLLLADPPYAFDDWDRLLGLARAGIVVAEHRRPLELPPNLVGHRSYRYGSTLVTVARARRGLLETESEGEGSPVPASPDEPEGGR